MPTLQRHLRCRGGLKTHPTALLYLCRVGLPAHHSACGVAVKPFRLPENMLKTRGQ
ncbi:MAG: hypothetical protein IKZ88_09305 [Neisseriaceae bacterium]|nr:hypothetical protein [Neisseriaceae bacterium]